MDRPQTSPPETLAARTGPGSSPRRCATRCRGAARAGFKSQRAAFPAPLRGRGDPRRTQHHAHARACPSLDRPAARADARERAKGVGKRPARRNASLVRLNRSQVNFLKQARALHRAPTHVLTPWEPQPDFRAPRPAPRARKFASRPSRFRGPRRREPQQRRTTRLLHIQTSSPPTSARPTAAGSSAAQTPNPTPRPRTVPTCPRDPGTAQPQTRPTRPG